MSQIFIIGWDGATFDLIEPWVAQGKLPTIARLMEQGVHGRLRSTLPPMTFPAWSSYMTGVNPGKHGIYDFTRQRPGSYELEFVNGGQRRTASFWKLLSQAGRQVISISVPCTFPPEPVNGVMISGFDAPGLGGPGAFVDARGMYPPELFDELNRTIGHHPIGAFIAKDINRGRPDLAIEQMIATVRAKAATAKYLMTNRPWDCCMILFGESDGVGHHFWKYCDPDSPLFEGQPAGLHDSILRVFQELDRQAAELLALLPADAVVLMMSDHGFGGVSNWVLYPNCWLRERGLLRFRGQAAHWKSRALDAVKLRAVSVLPGRVKRAIYRLSRKGLGGIEARVRYAMIDWSGTEAYFEENPYYPVLWINLKGRQPGGTVEPGRHYEEVRDRVIGELEAWRHPETGDPIVEKAYRREEVYAGPCLEEAPDVIVKWAPLRGYTYAFKLSSKSHNLAWIEQVDPQQPENLRFFTSKSGSHRDDGIFLAHGPGIRAGATLGGARIIDLAPTILHLAGVPVSSEMDGRVLNEIFTEAATRAVPVQTVSASASTSAPAAEDNGHFAYGDEDEEIISERLKALGYME
jgi:predicted AlkP superfamily phosphohydrolase/phosphomutase